MRQHVSRRPHTSTKRAMHQQAEGRRQRQPRVDRAVIVEDTQQATPDLHSRFKKSQGRRGHGHLLDGPLDDRQEPFAAVAPRGLAGGQGRIVAGVLSQLVDDPVGQVHRRIEEEHRLHDPLDHDHPEIAAADVGQLVEEHPGQLLGRQAFIQVGGDDDGRPQEPADGGRVELEVDRPANGDAEPDRAAQRLDVDRQQLRPQRDGLADQPSRGHDAPDEPPDEEQGRSRPNRASSQACKRKR